MKNNTQTTARRHFKFKTLFRFLLVTFIGLSSFTTQAQGSFNTTWDVEASDLDITIHANTENYAYNYTVDFGDGTVLTEQTGNVTHNYSTPIDHYSSCRKL